MMKNITYYFTIILLLIFHLSVVCGKQHKDGNLTNLLNNPRAGTFPMTWHGGGTGRREGMAVEPGCLRVYEIRMLETPPREAVVLSGSEAQYGWIEFSDFGRTKCLCGLKKSSERNADPDIFFVDINQNGRLEQTEILKGTPVEYPPLDKIHYGVIDIPLRDRNQSRVHRVFVWYGKYDDLYLVSHCYMQGRIRLGDKEVTAVLVDYNCDGCYDSNEGQRALDRIGWNADGDDKIDWSEQHFVGSHLVSDGDVFQIGCTPDGKTLAVVPVDVPMGRLQMPTENAFVCLIGDEGPMNLKIMDGAIDLPVGTYRVDYLYIEEADENRNITRLRKSGQYFFKPWEIRAGVTTTIDRDMCIITDADKRNYEDRMRELRGKGSQPKSVSLLNEPLGELNDFGMDFDPTKIKGMCILICFWDMQQRPSRYCITQLGKRADQLKGKNVAVITMQTSRVNKDALDEWIGKKNIPFPVGMIQDDEKETRFNWGVKCLPWLILTDKEHVVRAEGFGLDELEDKICEVEGAQ